MNIISKNNLELTAIEQQMLINLSIVYHKFFMKKLKYRIYKNEIQTILRLLSNQNKRQLFLSNIKIDHYPENILEPNFLDKIITEYLK